MTNKKTPTDILQLFAQAEITLTNVAVLLKSYHDELVKDSNIPHDMIVQLLVNAQTILLTTGQNKCK